MTSSSTTKTERKRRKPTITDVAKHAGVSVATVSYVLNGRLKEASRETADRILESVRKLGYVKNLAAASLSGKNTKLIAVIIPGISLEEDGDELNPFYGEFIFRLEQTARSKGYGLCIRGGDANGFVPFLIERGVETAILVGISEWELPDTLDKNNIHCILYDSFSDASTNNQVRTDEIKGGYLAAEHLIGLRKNKLIFAGEIKDDQIADVVGMRLRGARKACEMAEIDPIQRLDVKVNYEAGYKAAEKISKMNIDGIVATADILAVGLMEGLKDRGIRIPEDIAVVGYDNLPICKFIRPRLTTIDQGLADKVNAVMSMIESREQGLIKTVSPHVVVRDST